MGFNSGIFWVLIESPEMIDNLGATKNAITVTEK
jgi:hypothetical protein